MIKPKSSPSQWNQEFSFKTSQFCPKILPIPLYLDTIKKETTKIFFFLIFKSRSNKRETMNWEVELTENVRRLREHRAKNPEIPGRDRDSFQNRTFVPLHDVRIPRPIKPHPKPRTSLLLPGLRRSRIAMVLGRIQGTRARVRVRVSRRCNNW